MKTYSTVPGLERSRMIHCNLCGAQAYHQILATRDYTFVKCSKCGLAFQNPQPIFADLRARYGQNYFEYELRNEENFFQLMKLGLRDIRFFQLTRNLDDSMLKKHLASVLT